MRSGPGLRALRSRVRLPWWNFAAVVLASVLATVGSLVVVPTAEARITKIQVTSTETPTFGGYSWPGVGQYEKIVGKAFGEVDPSDPKNAVIVDIGLAPRNIR